MSTSITGEYTVPGQLLRWSKDNPDKPAFIFRGTMPGNQRVVLTRHDLLSLSGYFAAVLSNAGIEKGDVVCNTLPNSPERLITDLGLMVAGAVTMNGMVFLADGADLSKSLAKANCVALVVDVNQPRNALTVLEDRVIVRGENAQCREAPNLRKVFRVDCGGGIELRPWLEELKQKEERYVAKVNPSDPAFVFTTSGTSGFSKLVPRTHEEFIFIGRVFHDVIDPEPDDIIFNERSFGWLGGAFFTYIAKGTTRVLVDMTAPPQNSMEFALDCILAENCTVAVLLPPQLSAILAKPEREYGNLRTIITGGMPLSKQQVQVVGQVCKTLTITYASTEGGFITKNCITEDNKDDFEDGDGGLPVGDYSLKLVTEKGKEILPSQMGKTGEILLKGPQMFRGYLQSGMNDLKQQFTHDGWMKTTDVGYYNPRGHIHVVCRKSNAIMHGAFIIYPGWLEKKLEKCPGVQSVIIVPVPDPKMYQEMCCCVVADRTEQLTDVDVKTFCETLFSLDATSEFKQVPVPKYYVFFDQFPMLAGGTKPDRKKIFVSALEKLSLSGTTI